MGWGVEFLQASFLMYDDVMDQSQTRRGKECWYRLPNVSMSNALNDGVFIENAVYSLLIDNTTFDSRIKFSIMRLCHDITLRTIVGQHFDLNSVRPTDQDVDLSRYTFERYWAITAFKTAYYSFWLPVALGMAMAEFPEDQTDYAKTKEACISLGNYFQAQDDVLDVFGDPEVIGKVGTDILESKCSYVYLKARELLEAADDGGESRALLARLNELYRKRDKTESEVAEVKGIFVKSGVKEAFDKFEEEEKAKIDAIAKSICNENLRKKMPRKPAWLSEDDLLKEQADFLNGDKPAASVVRVGKEDKRVTFAEEDGIMKEDESRNVKAQQEAELASVDVPLARVMNDRVVERNPELNTVVAPPRAHPSSAAKGFPKPKLRAWRSKKLAEANVPLAQRKAAGKVKEGNGDNNNNNNNTTAVLNMSKEEREETMAEVQRMFSASNIEFLRERGRKKLEAEGPSDGADSSNKAGDTVTEGEDMYEGEVDLGYGNRLELDELEIDKQKWMEPVNEDEDMPRPEDETFEGRRFDFEGHELKRDAGGRYDPVLYHHGEEPGRPGYTVQELLVLSDSNNGGQRQLAIRTLGNIIEKEEDVSSVWIGHRQVHVRFAVSASHNNINFPQVLEEVEESPSALSVAHLLSMLLPLAPKLQDICGDIVNDAAERYRVDVCNYLLPYVDDYYRASQIGAMRVLGGLESPKRRDLDWCCAGLDRWCKGVKDATMDTEELRSYLPLFSRYMCLRNGDDTVVLHALKVVESLWTSDSHESFYRSLVDCVDSVVQKIEDKVANKDPLTDATVFLLELLLTAFTDAPSVKVLIREPELGHWLLDNGRIDRIGRVLFMLALNDNAVNTLNVKSLSSTEEISAEVFATICRYRPNAKAAARGLKFANEDTLVEALRLMWHTVGLEGPWDASTPLSIVNKASVETVAQIGKINREVAPLLQWGDMAIAVINRVGDFTKSLEASSVAMKLLTSPSCDVPDADTMKWESARVELRRRVQGGVPTALECSLLLALCSVPFPLSSRVDVWCDTDLMIVIAKTDGIEALTGERDLSAVEDSDLADRESQSLLRVWREQCQNFLREASEALSFDDRNLVVRAAKGIEKALEGI
ncbi:hypothetical protein FOL47_011214 [Perkinsus chesapeaki]|uniref:RPAP1 C-terminal domain-containing protein n=1 Tax=Perkinsus chesapeaki TaxID=330153 RepID=A0A7J6MN55_PERCH|nr:hypothetical protein FOL47_011214 [Perkinsus chesapeaki]